MGIRIHKMLGYGFTDLEMDENGHRIVDERINRESPLITYEREDVDDYLRWLAKRDNMNLEAAILRDRESSPNKHRAPLLTDAISFGGEFGISGVLIMRPLCFDDWYRFDDTIDWIESTYFSSESQRDDVQVLRHGIYPYSASYMDARDGKRLSDHVMHWIRARERFIYETDQPLSEENLEMLDLLAKTSGFADHAEAERYVAPTVPQEIKDLAEYAELFSDEKAYLGMRPMLYTYWG